MNKLSKNFILFIGIVMMITFVLAGFGLYMYRAQDAHNLDLSRPGYQELHKEVIKKNDLTVSIKKEGEIDKKFIKLVNQKMTFYQGRITAKNAFSKAGLSNKTLGLDVEN